MERLHETGYRKQYEKNLVEVVREARVRLSTDSKKVLLLYPRGSNVIFKRLVGKLDDDSTVRRGFLASKIFGKNNKVL